MKMKSVLWWSWLWNGSGINMVDGDPIPVCESVCEKVSKID